MDEIKSKSEKKREAERLQKLGVKLVDLSPSVLATLPLTETLLAAIETAKTLKSHGAIRRQAQLIGKLMRASDYEAISAAFEALLAEDSAQTETFHLLEQWRERLMTEGKEALTDFIDVYHPEDIQQLRVLVKKAIDEKERDVHTGAGKALFRYLRTCVS